jgi:hypothetical protein
VIYVAYCQILFKSAKFSADRESEGREGALNERLAGVQLSAAVEGGAPWRSSADVTARTTVAIIGPAAPRGRAPPLFLAHMGWPASRARLIAR